MERPAPKEKILKGDKFILFLMLISVFGLFSLPIQAQQHPGDVWLVVPQGVQQGDKFHVEMHINTGSEQLAAYAVTLAFNPDIIKIDSFAGNDGIEIIPPYGFNTVGALSSGDQIICNGYTLSPTGPGSDLHTLNIHFNALNRGLTKITVDALLLSNGEINIGVPHGINAGLAIGSTETNGDVNMDGTVDIVDAMMASPVLWNKKSPDSNRYISRRFQ
jgi:hypothetical protein